MPDKKRATLILEDGTQFQGFSFGEPVSVRGETVFNTSMTGYPEILTDPSSGGAILILTYPLIGNYGVPNDEVLDGLSRWFESEKIHIRALVVTDYSFEYSHWNAVRSLDQWLREHGVPAIYGVDTREITRIIRDRGAMRAMLLTEGSPEPADRNDEDMIAAASCRETTTYGNGKHKVVLVDCGVRHSVIKNLVAHGATVVRVPWDHDFAGIDHDAVVVSNGPGDPKKAGKTIENIKKAFAAGKPMLGIGLGHQLMALAAGGDTYKLKYGHHGANQPVRTAGSDSYCITRQNHLYAVDHATLPAGWEPWLANLNDGSNEGMRHKSLPFFSVQFDPVDGGGVAECEHVYDTFIKNTERWKAGKK